MKPLPKKIDPLIYIAAPFSSGSQHANVGRAIRAGDDLLKAGVLSFVPHSWAQNDMLEDQARPYETWIAICLRMVSKCDAVLRLEGASPGADRETCHAASLGIPVLNNVDDAIAWAKGRYVPPMSTED